MFRKNLRLTQGLKSRPGHADPFDLHPVALSTFLFSWDSSGWLNDAKSGTNDLKFRSNISKEFTIDSMSEEQTRSDADPLDLHPVVLSTFLFSWDPSGWLDDAKSGTNDLKFRSNSRRQPEQMQIYLVCIRWVGELACVCVGVRACVCLFVCVRVRVGVRARESV